VGFVEVLLLLLLVDAVLLEVEELDLELVLDFEELLDLVLEVLVLLLVPVELDLVLEDVLLVEVVLLEVVDDKVFVLEEDLVLTVAGLVTVDRVLGGVVVFGGTVFCGGSQSNSMVWMPMLQVGLGIVGCEG
jgi:hypothetical protein